MFIMKHCKLFQEYVVLARHISEGQIETVFQSEIEIPTENSIMFAPIQSKIEMKGLNFHSELLSGGSQFEFIYFSLTVTIKYEACFDKNKYIRNEVAFIKKDIMKMNFIFSKNLPF